MDTDEQTRQSYDDREDVIRDDEPHTHVICGWQADPSHGIDDDGDIDWDGRVG